MSITIAAFLMDYITDLPAPSLLLPVEPVLLPY